jgi:Rieske Fe-S protein
VKFNHFRRGTFVTEQKITRRQVIGGAAVAGVGVPLLAACGSGDTIASDDGAASSTSSGPQTLGPTSDVAVGSGKIYTDANVVVTQPTAGSYVGFSATCTHQGCQVSSISGSTIDCACHGSKFSIKDGSVVQGPATQALEKVAVAVQGSDLVEQG